MAIYLQDAFKPYLLKVWRMSSPIMHTKEKRGWTRLHGDQVDE